jgi:hypothetical protein
MEISMEFDTASKIAIVKTGGEADANSSGAWSCRSGVHEKTRLHTLS